MSWIKMMNKSLYEIDREKTVRKLSKHYPLNEENNAFQLALRYEKASDLFDENTDTLGMPPRISDAVTDQMAGMLDDIPGGYSADFNITVEDFEDYSSEQIMDGIKDSLFFRHLRYLKESSRKGIKTGALIVIGIILILVLNIGKRIGWWGGNDSASEILTYLLDTFGCVLIWEGFYSAFLEKPDSLLFEEKLTRKINSISLYKENENSALASDNKESISKILAVNQEKQITKRLLQVGGFSMICVGVAYVLETLGDIISYKGDVFSVSINITMPLLLEMISAVMIVYAGFMSLRAYQMKLRRAYMGWIAALFVLYKILTNLASFVGLRKPLEPIEMILDIFAMISGSAFLIGYGMYFAQCLKVWRQAEQGEAGD